MAVSLERPRGMALRGLWNWHILDPLECKELAPDDDQAPHLRSSSPARPRSRAPSVAAASGGASMRIPPDGVA